MGVAPKSVMDAPPNPLLDDGADLQTWAPWDDAALEDGHRTMFLSLQTLLVEILQSDFKTSKSIEVSLLYLWRSEQFKSSRASPSFQHLVNQLVQQHLRELATQREIAKEFAKETSQAQKQDTLQRRVSSFLHRTIAKCTH